MLAVAIFAAMIFLAGCSTNSNNSNNNQQGATMNQSAIISTNAGQFTIALDSQAAPKTVENFIQKARSDYYKGFTFHRVEDWVTQGGDPKGDGTGGGDQKTELSDRNFAEGAVGVARGGDINISNDSQFFICTKDCTFLNNQYTYFGKVTSGIDVVKQIKIGDKIESIQIEEK